MPLRALVGVGFLGSLFGGAVIAIVNFFVYKVGRKIATRIAYVTVIGTMLLTLIGILQGLLAGLSFVLPQEYNLLLVNVLPGNTTTCLSAVITSTVARRVYDMKSKLATRTWAGI